MGESNSQEEIKRTKGRSKNPQYTKPKTIGEKWKTLALHNKLLVIFGAVGALGAVIAARPTACVRSAIHRDLISLQGRPRSARPARVIGSPSYLALTGLARHQGRVARTQAAGLG